MQNISIDDVVTFELFIALVILYTTGYGKELFNLIFCNEIRATNNTEMMVREHGKESFFLQKTICEE